MTALHSVGFTFATSGNSGTEVPIWLWAVFALGVLALLGIDMWSYRGEHKDDHAKDFRWTVIWIAIGVCFGGVVWAVSGPNMGQEYFGAYAIEKGLSLDNIFLFLLIFRGLKIPKEEQHDVLFWGVLGAVVFRGIFILLGIRALERWEWVTYIFAAILLYAAWKALREDPSQSDGESRTLNWLQRKLKVETDAPAGKFVTKTADGWAATSLLVALIAIELTDVMFAVDSVPAALSISSNTFVVFTSNIFAILGLRALYLYCAGKLESLRYLHYGLAAVLAFAALKILAHDLVEVPPLLSAFIVVSLIGGAVWASVRHRSGSLEKPGDRYRSTSWRANYQNS